MTWITCEEDGSKPPRKLRLKDFNSALARGNEAAVLKRLAKDVVCEWVGAAPVRGREAVGRLLRQKKNKARQELVIQSILTHGNAGSVSGTLRWTNGRSHGFCQMFQFSGARGALLQHIASYEIRK